MIILPYNMPDFDPLTPFTTTICLLVMLIQIGFLTYIAIQIIQKADDKIMGLFVLLLVLLEWAVIIGAFLGC